MNEILIWLLSGLCAQFDTITSRIVSVNTLGIQPTTEPLLISVPHVNYLLNKNVFYIGNECIENEQKMVQFSFRSSLLIRDEIAEACSNHLF